MKKLLFLLLILSGCQTQDQREKEALMKLDLEQLKEIMSTKHMEIKNIYDKYHLFIDENVIKHKITTIEAAKLKQEFDSSFFTVTDSSTLKYFEERYK